jgi:ferrous iron transport protein A
VTPGKNSKKQVSQTLALVVFPTAPMSIPHLIWGLFCYFDITLPQGAHIPGELARYFQHEKVAVMAVINLRQMKKHETGTILAVKVGGELGRRIREMGLVPGTEITIQGRAPLYDPVALRVMGGTLTLRNNEADYIIVETQ